MAGQQHAALQAKSSNLRFERGALAAFADDHQRQIALRYLTKSVDQPVPALLRGESPHSEEKAPVGQGGDARAKHRTQRRIGDDVQHLRSRTHFDPCLVGHGRAHCDQFVDKVRMPAQPGAIGGGKGCAVIAPYQGIGDFRHDRRTAVAESHLGPRGQCRIMVARAKQDVGRDFLGQRGNGPHAKHRVPSEDACFYAGRQVARKRPRYVPEDQRYASSHFAPATDQPQQRLFDPAPIKGLGVGEDMRCGGARA